MALPDGFELLPQFVPLPLGFLQLPAPLLEFVHRLVGPALVLHYVETPHPSDRILTYSAIMLRHVSGNKGQGVAGNSYSPATPLLPPSPGRGLAVAPRPFFALPVQHLTDRMCHTARGPSADRSGAESDIYAAAICLGSFRIR